MAGCKRCALNRRKGEGKKKRREKRREREGKNGDFFF